MSSVAALGLLLLSEAGQAGTPYRYWPGFSGKVSSVLWPADPSAAEDRMLTLVIRIDSDPQVEENVYKAAFHAACQRHRPEMLRLARRVSPDNDWRVRIRFDWPVASSGGVEVTVRRDQTLWLSNCRTV